MRWIQTNTKNQLDIQALKSTVEEDLKAGKQPLMVIGTAGDVSTGVVDDLDQIATICEEFDLWFHVDGAYYLPSCEIHGIAYRTNNASNTAYRGFGGPQGNMTIESILEDIATYLKKDAYEIRRKNIYEGKNTLTPYGQHVENNMLPDLFDNLYMIFYNAIFYFITFNILNYAEIK